MLPPFPYYIPFLPPEHTLSHEFLSLASVGMSLITSTNHSPDPQPNQVGLARIPCYQRDATVGDVVHRHHLHSTCRACPWAQLPYVGRLLSAHTKSFFHKSPTM